MKRIFTRTLNRIRDIYYEYPRNFWMMIFVNFIDRLGGSLLFPFFALYITKRFDVGMTEVGKLFAIFFISGFIGSFPGGALTDRFGRRNIIIFSLIATSFSTLLMGFVNEFQFFLVVAFISGIFTDVGGPAYEAVFMDVLPEEKRASGFGIRRVAFNLAVVIGPAIGGFIAARSYLALFIIDAVVSSLVALLVFLLIPETKPAAPEGKEQESTVQTFVGYLQVLRDGKFMVFTFVCLLLWFVYMNMNTTLGVFLRDQYGVPASGYGWLISINAAMVVLLQFPITRRLEKNPPMLMMAFGAIFVAGGLLLYGFVSTYQLFIVAMAILTIGEMITVPVANALVASFSPEEMRGRYNFVYGLSWGISFAAGPYLAGLVMDNYNPNWLWYACGIIGTLAILGFAALHWNTHAKPILLTQE
ncbi:MAG: MDR family MFS transporter [Chloroflexota bacterium]|nr:MFS transporter [Anaerolineales bacterium]